jgi:hypothetical protein
VEDLVAVAVVSAEDLVVEVSLAVVQAVVGN